MIANNGTGQSLTFNMGVVTRTGGLVQFTLPSMGAINVGATPLVNGILGLWATVTTTGGTFFATKDANNNVIASSSSFGSVGKDDITKWLITDDVTDVGGYFNTLTYSAVDSIQFNANATNAPTSTVTMGSNIALNVNSGFIQETANVGAVGRLITGGSLTSAAGEVFVTQLNTQGALTIASNLTGITSVNNLTGSAASSNLAFTKAGAGMVILAGNNNTYTGNTTISAGTLQISGGHAIGDYSQVVLANTASAVLDVNNTTETIGPLAGGGAVGGTVAIGTGKLTVNLNSDFFNASTVSSTYSGAITGSGSSNLIISGVGTLTLATTANSSFTGTVAVTNGATLALSGDGVNNLTAASAFTINGGTVILDYNATSTSGDRMADGAPVTMSNTAFQNNSQLAAFGSALDGLRIQTDVADVRTETIGAVTLAAGANTDHRVAHRPERDLAIDPGGPHADERQHFAPEGRQPRNRPRRRMSSMCSSAGRRRPSSVEGAPRWGRRISALFRGPSAIRTWLATAQGLSLTPISAALPTASGCWTQTPSTSSWCPPAAPPWPTTSVTPRQPRR